ncbi:hypothetical protein [Acidimangrovimonas sediminis]|uniref:hypothetical protein n=1 Tax=Acidimangrovimonas sediminis TaxID=2056283 RepID=UPI000C7FF44D|nr:hypothetical protein [Acidimangrovimonas sediminis]
MDPRLAQEIDRTLAERGRYFTPRWFARLFRGRLSLADSFWTGMFGPLLVVVPAMVLLAMLSKGVDPAAGLPVFSALLVVVGLYWAAVTRAVVMAAWRSPQAGGWRWTAVAVALLLTLAALWGGLRGVL